MARQSVLWSHSACLDDLQTSAFLLIFFFSFSCSLYLSRLSSLWRFLVISSSLALSISSSFLFFSSLIFRFFICRQEEASEPSKPPKWFIITFMPSFYVFNRKLVQCCAYNCDQPRNTLLFSLSVFSSDFLKKFLDQVTIGHFAFRNQLMII